MSRSEVSLPLQSDSNSNSHLRKPYLKDSSGRPRVVFTPPFAKFEQDVTSPDTLSTSNDVENIARHGGDLPLPTQDPEHVPTPQDVVHARPAQKRKPSTDEPRWWTFTSTQKAMKRVEDYFSLRPHQGEEGSHNEKQDEKAGANKEGTAMGPESEFSRRWDGQAISQNQAQTPDWNQPWTPFRMSSPDPYNVEEATAEGPDDPRLKPEKKMDTWWKRLKHFLLWSPFAPFWLRFANVAFTTATLGLAGHITQIELEHDAFGVLGVSTVFALVIAPLSFFHIFSALWFEYFGAPIGVWTVGVKMIHTLTELFFIALWSAELSLAFENYFTSPAVCTTWTPYRRFSAPPSDVSTSQAMQLCRCQAALVAMVFLSLLLYQAVLVVSLFRIFEKVSRPRR